MDGHISMDIQVQDWVNGDGDSLGSNLKFIRKIRERKNQRKKQPKLLHLLLKKQVRTTEKSNVITSAKNKPYMLDMDMQVVITTD